ncbi:MAG: alpha-E domain-containing protein [Desulfuromonadaceae bacterium]|nr:alpha-E domain-containing protein [Desulfuromonadaceae bacterium]MDD2847255.1 alpha-E domain-containing protein [Desulfuromonadaceae bacterium]MDD4130199.1 alpha-E domain-containing protein [Desulfuromonadaceae bacterium]
MLSRIADSMYWMARYLERAGETARLIEINLLYLVEAEEDMTEEDKWRPILQISSSEQAYVELFGDGGITTPRVLQFISAGHTNSSSIRTCLRLFRENARVARDRISKEMWEAVNEIWMGFNDRLKGQLTAERAGAIFVELRGQVARFNGLLASSMMRGEAYAFYQLGGCFERADMTARILDVKYHIILPDLSMVGSALDYYQWAALLKSLSGFEAFRRSYHSGFMPADIVEFVVLNHDFPRSIVFSIQRMEAALKIIGLENKDATKNAFAALMEIDSVTSQQIFKDGLHEYLEKLLERLAVFHSALAKEFFQ